MLLIIWSIIVIVVLLSAVLVFLEHEWGVWLGGSTAIILVISYFCAELLLQSPVARELPQDLSSFFGMMGVVAVALCVLALSVFGYMARRRR